MRAHLAVGFSAAALVVGTLLSAPPAHAHAAADPVSPYSVPFGNTYTTGTLTWHARSVTVAGEHKSVSTAGLPYCRATWAYTLNSAGGVIGQNGSSDSVVCGASGTFRFTVSADVPGGAAFVRVCLDDGNFKDLVCSKFGPRPTS
ncbi:hypothetical protein [Streptomyces beigongshangae]|uniref:hypothetical protein n=1 Tax=Streptomyces beigongshangae TaxID=2841597 RepID=UPI001C858FD1|nr:hypothetical protein [Streptomyces sp. REN17]